MMEADNRFVRELGRLLGYPDKPLILSKRRRVRGWVNIEDRESTKKSYDVKIKKHEYVDFIKQIERGIGEEFTSNQLGEFLDVHDTTARKLIKRMVDAGALSRRIAHPEMRMGGGNNYVYKRNQEYFDSQATPVQE